MAFTINKAAMDSIMSSPQVKTALKQAGKKVQDRARELARPIVPNHSRALNAIVVTEPTLGPDGWESKLGYDKTKDGWFLFYHEVGTINHGPTPHLRPAVNNID